MGYEDRIKAFITHNFYVADVAALLPETSLLDSGIVDSTGMLELISFLESEFSIRIEDQEMLPENLDSIGRIAAFIGRKTSAR